MAVRFGGKILISLMAAACLSGVPNAQDQAGGTRLAAILEKAAAYCQRLDRAALDFVCLEEVTELSVHFTPKTDVYLYDYQFVRKDQEVAETRKLIAVNGKKTKIRDSALMTVMLQYRNVLFGPVGLLGESWQGMFDYALIGEETIDKDKAVVIEAKPKAALSEPHCYGRVWIKEDDGSVLKILWDQRSLGNFKAIEDWAKAHQAEPRITAYSEYGVEKNGLRFPSRNFSESVTVTKDKLEIVNARMSAVYKDYKFFTVETEVKY
jgi:hypothetical protein